MIYTSIDVVADVRRWWWKAPLLWHVITFLLLDETRREFRQLNHRNRALRRTAIPNEKEAEGERKDGWMQKIFSHLLLTYLHSLLYLHLSVTSSDSDLLDWMALRAKVLINNRRRRKKILEDLFSSSSYLSKNLLYQSKKTVRVMMTVEGRHQRSDRPQYHHYSSDFFVILLLLLERSENVNSKPFRSMEMSSASGQKI